MQNVAVAVGEKYETVALIVKRLTEKIDVTALEFLGGVIEIGDADRQVADTGVFHLLGDALAGGGNDFEHGAVGGADKVVTVVGVVDAEIEVLDVPVRELLRVRRSDGGVL